MICVGASSWNVVEAGMPKYTNPETLLTWTKPHRRLMHLLADMGLEAKSEFPVGRYSLDAFCEDIWMGFEADGRKAHSMRRGSDLKRDTWIFEHAGIPVLRLDEQVLRKVCWEDTQKLVQDFIDEHKDTIRERRRSGEWTL